MSLLHHRPKPRHDEETLNLEQALHRLEELSRRLTALSEKVNSRE